MSHLFRAGVLLLAGAFVTYGLATFLQMNAARQSHDTAFVEPVVPGGSFYVDSANRAPAANNAAAVSAAVNTKSRRAGL